MRNDRNARLAAALLAVVAALAIPPGLASAEEEPLPVGQKSAYDTWPSSLGYYNANQTGYGLSWQHWFGANGVSLTGGGIYQPASAGDLLVSDIMDCSVQAQYLRMVHTGRFRDFLSFNMHLIGMAGYRGRIQQEYTGGALYPVPGPYTYGVFVGVGLGLEYTVYEHFSWWYDFVYVADLAGATLKPQFGSGARFRY